MAGGDISAKLRHKSNLSSDRDESKERKKIEVSEDLNFNPSDEEFFSGLVVLAELGAVADVS